MAFSFRIESCVDFAALCGLQFQFTLCKISLLSAVDGP